MVAVVGHPNLTLLHRTGGTNGHKNRGKGTNGHTNNFLGITDKQTNGHVGFLFKIAAVTHEAVYGLKSKSQYKEHSQDL